MEYEVEGTRPRGRPKKTWRQIVEKDCRARGLNREDAMDRGRCRKQTGMIDDHDECEWVNFSSGTGSPGLSQTIPRSRKMVVCVCVCVREQRENVPFEQNCFFLNHVEYVTKKLELD